MIGGYALKWVGLILILAGILMAIGGFGSDNGALKVLGLICMIGGGFARYVSRQTTRAAK
jgi:membrane-bound ClpP family serine protease